MLTIKALIKGIEINIVGVGGGVGGGVGKDCIVKRMHNFERAFAKVSQDFWPGL